jgi:3-deoxy-D-manno-octulosonate 8-phosphate phosphatase (KDO 8-P phosphatase)
LEKARNRQPPDEKGYVWRACLPKAKEVKLLLLDVDGILTDGTIIYTPEGNEIQAFHTRDGLGIKLLQEAGVEVGLITARQSEAVTRRAQDLGMKHVFQKTRNKLAVYEQLTKELGLQASEVGYMGDDWLDLPLLVRVGFSATVADAVPEVKEVAHYTTKRKGGRGAVREVCDLILEAKGVHLTLLDKYLNK